MSSYSSQNTESVKNHLIDLLYFLHVDGIQPAISYFLLSLPVENKISILVEMSFLIFIFQVKGSYNLFTVLSLKNFLQSL